MNYIAFTATWPLRKIRDTINSALLTLNSEKLEKIIDGSIFSRALADGSITTPKFKNDSVTEDKLADNSITASKILDGSVNENKLEDGAISTNHIALNTITLSRMTTLTQAKVLFDPLSLTSSKFMLESVTEDKIFNGSISTIKIKDLSVSNSKIIDGSITIDKILNYSLLNSNLSGDLISGDLILDGEITERAIMPSSISLNMLEDGIKNSIILGEGTNIDGSEYWIPNQKFILQPTLGHPYFPVSESGYFGGNYLLEVFGIDGSVIQKATPSTSVPYDLAWSRNKHNGVISDWEILGTDPNEICPHYFVRIIDKPDSNSLTDFTPSMLRFTLPSMGSILEAAWTNQYTNHTSMLYTMKVHASQHTTIPMKLLAIGSEVMVFVDGVTIGDEPIMPQILSTDRAKDIEILLSVGFHTIQFLTNSSSDPYSVRLVALGDIIGPTVSFVYNL